MWVYDVNFSRSRCKAANKCERQGTFFLVFTKTQPLQLWWLHHGRKLFHNTAGTVYLVKPDLIHRIFLHQNRSFKLETTALVSVYAAETQPLIWFLLRCCFIWSLIWSALHLIFFYYTLHYSPLEHLSGNLNQLFEQLKNLIESQGYERWLERCKLFNLFKENQEKFEENL